MNLEDILPHRSPALLVTEVLDQTEEAATVKGRIPFDHPWVADGRVSVLLVVDLAAQATGVLVGLRKVSRNWGRDRSHRGLLVSLYETQLNVAEIEAGQLLEARICIEGEAEGLVMASFCVTSEKQTVAQGRLGVFSPQVEN